MILTMRCSVLCLVLISVAGVWAGSPEYENGNGLEIVAKMSNSVGLPTKNCVKADVNGDGITFNFYTRERFLYNLTLKHIKEEILPAYYHVNKATKILVHGWNGFGWIGPFQRMVNDYLYTQNVNVITMDWSVYAKECSLESIFTDVTTVSGEVLNGVMKALLSRGTNATKFHVIGYGAGAHIAAVAGKMMHPHMIGRITALNPMGLNYDLSGHPKLETGDARLVDIIYTTTGAFVSNRHFGHIVFYPEGGRSPQPGCGENDVLCSMYKSISYFRRSILTPAAYPAKKIEGDFHGSRPELGGEGASYSPDNYMGEYVNPSKHGEYYVNVKGLPTPTSNAWY